MALKKQRRASRALHSGIGWASPSLRRSALPASVIAQEALEEIVVTARFREENLQQTPLAITAFTGDVPRSARRDEHARPRRVRAERGHRAARRRLGLDGRRLHSRHRLGRQLAVVRARRADLHRRRLSRPSARRRPGPARHRARRGAARPARHAVRQEHARRRRAHHFAQTRGRRHRLHRCRHRLARPLELARLVRLCRSPKTKCSHACRRRRKRRTATSTSSTTNASTARARSAWAVPASPRARTASRSRPRRPIRRIPRGSRTPRTPTPRSAACGSAACSAPPTRAAASSTTSATRTCSRAASRCDSSRPILSRSTSSPT